MKVILAFIACSLATISLASLENLDLINIRPIEELPGFWDGREQFRPKASKLTLKETGRITNGQEAKPGQFPHMAFIVMNLLHTGSFSCGASLISANRCLTAAHCPDDNRVANITVILGAHDRTIYEPTQLRVTVPRPGIIKHPDYERNTLENDICILKLPYSVEFTLHIRPIRLPTNQELENLFEDYPGTLSGWGLTENWVASPVLRFINYTIMPNPECALRWHHLVTDKHICSRTDGGRSGCNGDSGSAMLVKSGESILQAGIVSFGTIDCMLGWPSVYARVSKYTKWIWEQ